MTSPQADPDPDRTPPLAVVTGASAGIGRELARVLAAEGFRLAVVARREERLRALAGELEGAHGVRVHPIPMDLTAQGAPAALRSRTLELAGVPEVVVNNAGIGTQGAFAETPLEDTLRLLRLNLVALTALTRRFLPDLLDRGRGRILNVASTAAFQPGPWMATYYAGKAYVLHLSEALDEELRGTGVGVTTLCPGPTRTEFQARAEMETSGIADPWWVMDAAVVARAGYRGMVAGRRIVIPGLVNKLTATSHRYLPRRLVARIAGRLNA